MNIKYLMPSVTNLSPQTRSDVVYVALATDRPRGFCPDYCLRIGALVRPLQSVLGFT